MQSAVKNLEINNNNNFFNYNNYNNSNDENSSVLSKFKTATGFFRSENNNNKNGINSNNNFFNTQIKINNNNKENQADNNKNYNNNNYNNYDNNSTNNNKTPDKQLQKIDSPNRANTQNINSNPFNLSQRTSGINQTNQFQSMANKSTGILKFNSNSNNLAANNNDNASSDKQLAGFNATSDYFFQGSKISSNRVKSYYVYFINNWFEKNQIPFQNYTPHMVNNLEFQSNTIIDQMKVLLDSINHFKMQFLQGKNVKFYFAFKIVVF